MGKLAEKFSNIPLGPIAYKGKDFDMFHGVRIDDPYRHLETMDDPATLKWAHAHEDRFQQFIGGYDRRNDLYDFLKDVWNYPKKSMPARYGKRFFYSVNAGLDPQSKYMVADDEKGTNERVLIDPNTLSDDGTIDLRGTFPSPDGKYVAYLLSQDGDDKLTMHIRDVRTGKDLDDVIENCRFTSLSWDKDSHKGFTYNYPKGEESKSMVVKHHTIGKPAAEDTLVYERDDLDISIPTFYRPRSSTYEFITLRVGTDRNNGISYRKIGASGDFKELFKPLDSQYSPIGDVNGKIYMTTFKDAPNGKIVAFDPDKPEPENWETIVEENKDGPLEHAFLHDGKVYADYTIDCSTEIKVYDAKGKHVHDLPLPPQSIVTTGRVQEGDTSFLVSIGDYKKPQTQYKYDMGTNTLSLFKASAAKADMDECLVERVYATSKDGTKVPMTIIRHPDTKMDGTAAVNLYGYGGFNVPLQPGFSFKRMAWVREGGIAVIANLRGGGEFGSDWYDGGRLHNKQNVFDDFIACAETLIDKDYTSSERLVIEGGSNGGLLTAACMLQRPELFGCVLSHVGVHDMLRYHIPTYGKFWTSDYGNPTTDIDDFEITMGYSPLHNVEAGGKYPPMLIKTADTDTRVVPWHSYKLAAEMMDKADPDSLVMLSVEKNAGHGAGKPIEKSINEILDLFAFTEKAIGPIDQNEYKLSLDGSADSTPTKNLGTPSP